MKALEIHPHSRLSRLQIKWSLLTLFCLLIASVGGTAQEAPRSSTPAKAPDFTAEQILDKYVEVTGGKAAYEKLKSRSIKGTVEIVAQGIRGEVEVFQKEPNRYLESVTLASFGSIYKAYDGTMGWSQDPFQGLRDLSGVELASLKRDSRFNGEIHWRELYAKVELAGKEKVGDRAAYVVRLTPSEGSPITDYYDTETFMLLRHDTTEEGPQGKIPVEAYPSDYREIDGIKLPFTVQQKSPVTQATVKIASVIHNIEIPDARFSKPAKKD